MKKLYLLSTMMLVMMCVYAQTETLAFFSFNQLDSAPNTQTTIMADAGLHANTAVMYLNGMNGSSSWSSSSELNRFSGSSINLIDGYDGEYALAFRNLSANGKSAVFKLSTIGCGGLILTYAFRKTSSGFNECKWAYSVDAVNFSEIETKTYSSIGYDYQLETVDMSNIAELNNKVEIYIKLTVNGCTSSSGTVRLDNIRFNYDIYAPYIMTASITDTNKVKIAFNEDVEQTTAMNVSN